MRVFMLKIYWVALTMMGVNYCAYINERSEG